MVTQVKRSGVVEETHEEQHQFPRLRGHSEPMKLFQYGHVVSRKGSTVTGQKNIPDLQVILPTFSMYPAERLPPGTSY